jgi:hypothetical protein
MRLLKTGSFLLILSALFLTLSSSHPAPKPAVESAAVGYTSAELIRMAEAQKQDKLSFKEKLAIKLFNKKLNKMAADASVPEGGDKNQTVAWLLALFLGGLGIHRFYLGYTWQGVVQLLTAGGCGIWALIDFIRILTGSLQPKNGSYASREF